MDNYEKTIDLIHVFNYIRYSLKKIMLVTLTVAVAVTLLVVGKSINKPSQELYYSSTSEILFKFNSWSTTDKQYNLEGWNLVGVEKYKSDSNGAFMANSENIFLSNNILTGVLGTYD